jgi:transcriptional regulator with XRE-family HTH domain
MEILGQRIREERRKRNVTLEQLSHSTELSKSFLSQIERGQAYPSVTSLKKIAKQFGISVVSLFTDGNSNENNFGHLPKIDNNYEKNKEDEKNYVNDVKIVRGNRRKSLTLPGSNVSYDLLTPDLNRKIEVMHMRITPGETTGDPVIDPPGEKFCLVLKGTLEVKIADEVHQLEAGDTIYFPAHFPQSWRGLGSDPIEAIWVLSPPWF